MAVFAVCKRVKLTGTAAVAIHTVGDGRHGVLAINVAALLAHKIKLAVTAGAAPADDDWIEFNAPIPLGGALERTGIVAPAGFKIFAQTDIANSAAVQVWGLEETS